MARIRSIHPGLFTDEAFVTLSDAAQIFFLGLWTEADDQGVFEWKPVTLRMRLRPTKDGSVEALLAEIEAVDSIRRFELGGRHYGAIRNFRKYQRPKKPNSVHPITDEIRTYVALNTPSSELEGDEEASVPQKGEIAPQMEDGGGKRKDGRGRVDSAAVAPPPPITPPVVPPKPEEPEIPDFLKREPNGTRWAEGRTVPPEWVTEADLRRKANDLVPVNLGLEAEKFVNHWLSKTGKDATKRDWKGTWINWALAATPPRGSPFQREQAEILRVV